MNIGILCYMYNYCLTQILHRFIIFKYFKFRFQLGYNIHYVKKRASMQIINRTISNIVMLIFDR